MKRLIQIPCLTFLMFILFACEKESITPAKDQAAVIPSAQEEVKTINCVSYSYTDKVRGVVNFGNARADAIIVGFTQGLSLAQRQLILSQYRPYKSTDGDSELDSGTLTIVNLKPGTTCAAVATMLAQLETNASVRFAAPVFNPDDPTTFLWTGLTNEVIVTMKNGQSRNALETMCSQTNTSIVAELSPETFIVSTSKNSAGDALEISTLFNQSIKVYNAEPNLLFQLLPFNGKDNNPGRKYTTKRLELTGI